LMTTLKQLVLRDLFPHLSERAGRRFLTASAFVVTLMITIWTFFFSPLIAVYMAAAVHRAADLSDQTDQAVDKAKRKEKNALELQEHEDKDEMLAYETELMEEHKKR
jgi:hypothetical protein